MSDLSSSATAPKTVKTILPAGVVVSICSLLAGGGQTSRVVNFAR